MKAWLFLPLLLIAQVASAQIEWRISVKFILDAAGNRPAGGALSTDDQVRAQIDAANEILGFGGRGYRCRATEIVDVNGVSQWFMADSHDEEQKKALENAARNNTALYAYRNNAINVYI